VNENPTVSVIRKRSIGDGFHEDLTVLNHGAEPLELELRVDAGSDFADPVRRQGRAAEEGETYARVDDATLVLGYRRNDFVRETRIRSSQEAALDEHGLSFALRVEPHDEWNTCLFVQPVTTSVKAIKHRHEDEEATRNIGMSLSEFLASAPELDTDWDPLEHIYERSLVDLAALRFETTLFPGQPMPAAGLPWFMTVFGRDSLIASFQALPFVPELAETTLRVLARYQATEVDDFRDAEPGKILHEIRFGELTHFGERPHSPYYGTADATPFFLVLLDEFERWTGNAQLVRELESAARAALEWIDRWGDRDGDGYVECDRRNKETGLENQCWKDSWDSIRRGFADGTMAEGEGGYNPIRYHNGTVWPHDNALIAYGLARYGFREEAATIALATLEAAVFFRYRLPEVFAGYRRGRTSFPVEYPTASSPQAWATGTPLLLLRVLLGLEPDGDGLRADPHLAGRIGRIELREIPGRWGRASATTEKEEVLG
jgi:glycogen debranching enzyme